MFKAFVTKPCNIPHKGFLSEVNTADPFLAISTRWDGTIDTTYHVNFIDLLDRVFMEGGFHPLSIEQERVFKKFLKEADAVTKAIQNKSTLPSETELQDILSNNLDDVFKQLDQFLGSYLGVNNGQFAG